MRFVRLLAVAVALGAGLMLLFPGSSWLYMAKLLGGLIAVSGLTHVTRRVWAPTLVFEPQVFEASAEAEAVVFARCFGLGFFHVSLELFGTHEALFWGGGRREARFSLGPARRGIHTATARFSFEDPFGFHTAPLALHVQRPCVVGPQTVPVGPTVLTLLSRHLRGGLRNSGAGFDAAGTRPYQPGDRLALVHWPQTVPVGPRVLTLLSRHLRGGLRNSGAGFDAAGTRPYQPGDRLALVHWPQTVRQGQLHIKHRTDDGPQPLWLLFDTRSEAYRDEGQFELAVSVTASLLKALWGAKRPAGLIAGPRRLEARRGLEAQLHALTVALKEGTRHIPTPSAFDVIVVTGSIQPREGRLSPSLTFLAGHEEAPGTPSRTVAVPDLSALSGHPAAREMDA